MYPVDDSQARLRLLVRQVRAETERLRQAVERVRAEAERAWQHVGKEPRRE